MTFDSWLGLNWPTDNWTDSHLDYFSRNVIAVRSLGGSGVTGPDPNRWVSNAQQKVWPDADEAIRWIQANDSYPVISGQDAIDPDIVQEVLEAAIDRLAERCCLLVRKIDGNPTVTVADPGVASVGAYTLTYTTAGDFTLPDVSTFGYGDRVYTFNQTGVSVTHKQSVGDGGATVATSATGGQLTEIIATPSGWSVSTQITGQFLPPIQPAERAEIPPRVHTACLMQAARWYHRRKSPQGFVGVDGLGGVVRSSSLDGDIEALIANDVVFGLA